MLRVNSSSVLVVPPFECAWLSGQEVSNESCCISFDAKGAANHCQRHRLQEMYAFHERLRLC